MSHIVEDATCAGHMERKGLSLWIAVIAVFRPRPGLSRVAATREPPFWNGKYLCKSDSIAVYVLTGMCTLQHSLAPRSLKTLPHAPTTKGKRADRIGGQFKQVHGIRAKRGCSGVLPLLPDNGRSSPLTALRYQHSRPGIESCPVNFCECGHTHTRRWSLRPSLS